MRLARSRTRLTRKSQWWVYAPYPHKKKNTHLTMSVPSRLRVTRRKRLISVFVEGSRQSKELAKDLTSDNQRLCDSTGLEPITFRLLAGLRPYPHKKKNTHFSVSAPSGLRVTRRKRLISVFGEGSRQSKEL